MPTLSTPSAVAVPLPRGWPRRSWLAAAASCSVGGWLASARAQPAADAASLAGSASRGMRIVVPFMPGGSIDISARLVAHQLGESLGLDVSIDNRPGNSGNTGFEWVARAPKDGHTLLMANAGLAANPHVYPNLAFDPLRDFAPIILVAWQPHVLLVHPTRPYKTAAEFIAHAQQNPGRVRVGTSGLAGPQDVAARLFMHLTGTRLNLVHYKGAVPALADLQAGQLDAMFETAPTAVPNALTNRLRALAVTTPQRLPALPRVPPLLASVPGYSYVTWIGLLAPAGTPTAWVERLNALLQTGLSEGALGKQVQSQHLLRAGGSVADFAVFLRRESAYYARLTQELKLTAPLVMP